MKRLIDVSMLWKGMLGRRSMWSQQITKTNQSSLLTCAALFVHEVGGATYMLG